MPQAYLRVTFLLAALCWAGQIFYLSGRPSIETPTLFPGQDKVFHLIEFGILGFLAMGALRASPAGYRPRQLWGVAAVVTLYGILDEWHQYFVPGRNADIYDIPADAVGGLLGAWTMYWLVRILVRRSAGLSERPVGADRIRD